MQQVVAADGGGRARARRTSMRRARRFPYPIYNKWFTEYSQAHPDVKINYQSIGSGGGIKQVTEGTVDFGASDGPMTDEQIGAGEGEGDAHPDRAGRGGADLQRAGRQQDLNFSGDVIADIYLGKITKWNDPRIAKDNPGVKLAGQADSAGVSLGGQRHDLHLHRLPLQGEPGVGRRSGQGHGGQVAGRASAQKGNEGVAGMVRQTPGAFGYVELIYALQNKMQYGAVRNAAGKFVQGTTDGVTAAAAAAAKTMPADYRVSITNAPGATSYPISSFTWLLIPTQFSRSGEGQGGQGLPDLDAGPRRERGPAWAMRRCRSRCRTMVTQDDQQR